jgi:hypothetical protein
MSTAHRWAWPASLAAMTSAAAILLVMLVARPGLEMTGRGIETQTNVNARHSGLVSDRFASDTKRAGRNSDEPMLTAATAELPSNFLTWNGRATGNTSPSTAALEVSDSQFRSSELLQRLLHERGGDSGPPIL